jgi:hypothetical protein
MVSALSDHWGTVILLCAMQMSLLNVSDNKLKGLPESIGACSSLEEFQANGIHQFLQFYHDLISVPHPLLSFHEHALKNNAIRLILCGIFSFLQFANLQKSWVSQSYPPRMLSSFIIGVKVDLALFGTQTQHAPQQNMGAAEHLSFSSPMLVPTVHLTGESHVRFCAPVVK